MKKNTIIKIVIALFLLRVDMPIGVDLFPNFLGFALLLWAATDLMRLHKNMWWLRCVMLALSALSFVMWIWQPKYALVTIPVGLLCAGALYMFLRALAEIYHERLPGKIASLDIFALLMLALDVISVIGTGLMGGIYFVWAGLVSLILMVLIDIRLYTVFCIVTNKD